MRRVTAICIGLVLLASARQGSTLHVHAYVDHDHPEHHHGLSAHEHPEAVTRHDEDHDSSVPGDVQLQLNSCDPGTHAVTIVMGCARLPQVHVIDGVSTPQTVLVALVPLTPVTEPTDVRVHGPPPRTQAPPRAPPVNYPA